MNGAWWLPVGQPCYHLSTRLCSQQDGSSNSKQPRVDVTGGMEKKKRTKFGLKLQTNDIFSHGLSLNLTIFTGNRTMRVESQTGSTLYMRGGRCRLVNNHFFIKVLLQQACLLFFLMRSEVRVAPSSPCWKQEWT